MKDGPFSFSLTKWHHILPLSLLAQVTGIKNSKKNMFPSFLLSIHWLTQQMGRCQVQRVSYKWKQFALKDSSIKKKKDLGEIKKLENPPIGGYGKYGLDRTPE